MVDSNVTLIRQELASGVGLTLTRYSMFFMYLLDFLTSGNRLHLFTLFSKIAFLDNQYRLTEDELRAFHIVRKFIEGEAEDDVLVRMGFQYSLWRMLTIISSDETSKNYLSNIRDTWQENVVPKYEVRKTADLIRGSIIGVDHDSFRVALIDESSGQRLEARFDIAEVNELFNISIQHLESRIPLPVTAHFIENKFVDTGVFIPSSVVFDPDYLIDVTAIANCFTPSMELPLINVMQQFLPKSTSPHLLIGNIANSILDQFMLGKSISYEKLMQEVFHQYALSFSILSDEEVSDVANQSRLLIDHLYSDVQLLQREHQKDIAYIEPTFISSVFGIQGRLDALFLSEDYEAGEIVELKSGKPFMANEYGLSRSHYIQTLLYDMAVKSAFGDKFQSTNYILYCKLVADRLRQAPTIKSVKNEALKVRNDLIAIYHHMINCDEKNTILFRFDHPVFQQAGGYVFRDAQKVQFVFDRMSAFEKKHFLQFVRLLTSENYMAKVGGQLGKNRLGFAALWRSDVAEKEENFNILRKLKIDAKVADGVYHFLIENDAALSNFRRGDIVVLYPHSREDQPIAGQLLKGSITAMRSEIVEIRLRNPLLNPAVFESINYWNAEHDFIESGTRHGYRSLLKFYSGSAKKRSVFLGLERPSINHFGVDEIQEEGLTNIQVKLLGAAMAAQEYYLLWGPPGTGKTSIMLSAMVRQLMSKTESNLLLVAYTNRAVDEICAVLDNNSGLDYIRIGSRFSVPDEFQSRLLQNQLKSLHTRKEVKQKMQSCRIFTGTLASVLGKEELFALKSFDVMIVDEASQILEPHLLGLTMQVGKTIFIGDHKQLPAVVVTDEKSTRIDDEDLNAAGYKSTADSLFERLYRTCMQNGWDDVIGRLNRQGRMHTDINRFVAGQFYEGDLQIIESDENLNARLLQPLPKFYKQLPIWNDELLDKRILMVNVDSDGQKSMDLEKTNEAQAKCTVEIANVIYEQLPKDATIGIVCPFRAQIALIRHKLEELFGRIPDRITIDTVERYQGGARDIILLSTCAANMRTFESIRSSDRDGADRKLNVALSRAREQVIVIGDMSVLCRQTDYEALIAYAQAL